MFQITNHQKNTNQKLDVSPQLEWPSQRDKKISLLWFKQSFVECIHPCLLRLRRLEPSSAEPGVLHTPEIPKSEAGGWWIWGWPGLQIKTRSQNKINHLMIIQEPIDWKQSTQMPQASSFTWPCFLFCNHGYAAFSYSELPVVGKLLWSSKSGSSSHLLWLGVCRLTGRCQIKGDTRARSVWLVMEAGA